MSQEQKLSIQQCIDQFEARKKERKKASVLAWRKKNPEKIKEYNKTYKIKHRDSLAKYRAKVRDYKNAVKDLCKIDLSLFQ